MFSLDTGPVHNYCYPIQMDRRTEIIEQITAILKDPKLVSLSSEEVAIILYKEVLDVELQRVQDAWTRILYTPDGNGH